MFLQMVMVFFLSRKMMDTFAQINHGNILKNTTDVKEITLEIKQHSKNNNKTDKAAFPPLEHTQTNLLLNSRLYFPSGVNKPPNLNKGFLKYQQLLDFGSPDKTLFKDKNVVFEVFDATGDGLKTSQIPKEAIDLIFSEISKTVKNNKDQVIYMEKKVLDDTNTTNKSEKIKEDSSIKNSKENPTEKNETSVLDPVKNDIPLCVHNENFTLEENENVENKSKLTNSYGDSVVVNKNGLVVNNKSDINRTSEKLETFEDDAKESQISKNKNTTVEVSILPQPIEEIPLKKRNPIVTNKSKFSPPRDKQKDIVGQNIKRDILLGNFENIFDNSLPVNKPPPNRQINNNNRFQKQVTFTPMNPFLINNFATQKRRPSAGRSQKFSSSFSSAKNTVETFKSIQLNDNKQNNNHIRNQNPGRHVNYNIRHASRLESTRRPVSFTRSSSSARGGFSLTPTQSTHRYQPTQPSRGFSANPEAKQGVEIIQSVNYELPEEVGTSLLVGGESENPAEFKRRSFDQTTTMKSLPVVKNEVSTTESYQKNKKKRKSRRRQPKWVLLPQTSSPASFEMPQAREALEKSHILDDRNDLSKQSPISNKLKAFKKLELYRLASDEDSYEFDLNSFY